jgi:hypothetical protein
MADHTEPEISKGNGDSPRVAGDHAVMPDTYTSCATHEVAVATALVEAWQRAGVTGWIAPGDVKAVNEI